MLQKYSVRNLLIHLIFKVLKILDGLFVKLKVQEAITSNTISNRLTKTLDSINERGIKVTNIFDIGAHSGEFSLKLKKLYPKSKFYLFEANNSHKKILEKLPFYSYIVTLSDKKKIVHFYNTGGGTGDSYYKEHNEAYENIDPEKQQAISIDEFIEDRKLPLTDFIKIDTQGSELDILQGAKKSLNNCQALLVELSIIEYNKGSPKFCELISFLEQHNFIPYTICEEHFKKNALNQIDLLFVNSKVYKILKINEKSN
jgi:FkbM family methyltransferase